jgi:2-oxo-4-hydroxy-4-carboxy-5-ureidoimidazoline decarboxylase
MIAVSPEQLTACLAVPRWVDDVASASPFASLDELLDRAAAAASPLSPAEIDEAIAHHPRIGEKPNGSDQASDFARAEQSAANASDDDLAAVIAAGNAAYEQKFGRVFIIRAAGRGRPEIIAELRRRLELDDDEELAIVGQQLTEIAIVRLATMFADAA